MVLDYDGRVMTGIATAENGETVTLVGRSKAWRS